MVARIGDLRHPGGLPARLGWCRGPPHSRPDRHRAPSRRARDVARLRPAGAAPARGGCGGRRGVRRRGSRRGFLADVRPRRARPVAGARGAAARCLRGDQDLDQLGAGGSRPVHPPARLVRRAGRPAPGPQPPRLARPPRLDGSASAASATSVPSVPRPTIRRRSPSSNASCGPAGSRPSRSRSTRASGPPRHASCRSPPSSGWASWSCGRSVRAVCCAVRSRPSWRRPGWAAGPRHCCAGVSPTSGSRSRSRRRSPRSMPRERRGSLDATARPELRELIGRLPGASAGRPLPRIGDDGRRRCEMETVTVVISVGRDRVDEFEAGFREYELPVWRDLEARGLLISATLSRLDISTTPVDGATQYLVACIFATGKATTPTTAIPASRRGTRSPMPTRSATHRPSAARPSSASAWRICHEDRRDRSPGLDRRVRRLGSARRVAADDRGRPPGGAARLRIDLAVRPFPHGPAADRRDHLRVVHLAGGAGGADRARPARAHRHLHGVPQPGPDGQDDLDDGLDQRRPDGARHRRRLEARRVARLRLRLPRDEGAAGAAGRRPRASSPRCSPATSTSTRRTRAATPRSGRDQRPEADPAAARPDHGRRQRAERDLAAGRPATPTSSTSTACRRPRSSRRCPSSRSAARRSTATRPRSRSRSTSGREAIGDDGRGPRSTVSPPIARPASAG